MKIRVRTIAKRVLLIGIVGIIVTLGVLSLPRSVEGVYSTGALVDCLCEDGFHFFRLQKGRMVYHTTHDEEGLVIGRYEVKEDGRVAVYEFPLGEDDPEELILTLGKPRVGFAIASDSASDDWSLLRRHFITDEIADVIANQDIIEVTFPDESTIVTTFYDKDHEIIRKETEARQLPERPEQGAGP